MEYDDLTKYLVEIHDKVGAKEFTTTDLGEFNVDFLSMLKSTGMIKETLDKMILTEDAISLVKA